MAVHHISKKTPRISIRGVLGQRIVTAQSAALAAPQLCGIAVAVDERRHFDDCAVVALGFGTQRETVVVAGNGRLIVVGAVLDNWAHNKALLFILLKAAWEVLFPPSLSKYIIHQKFFTRKGTQ